MNYSDKEDLSTGKVIDGVGISLAEIAGKAAAVAAVTPLYDELIAAINEGDVTEDHSVLSQLALSMSNQMRAKKVFLTTGTANEIVLTTPTGKQPVKVLQEQDDIHFTVGLTNTSTVQVSIDGLGPIAVANIVSANQLFNGALATISYINGSFWLTKQINPLTGNDVKDMAKVITDSLDIIEVGEIALDGATLKRAEHPIYWAKVQATSNLIDQATKDADLKTYAGYYGDGDGETTFTLPTLGGEFIRGYDNGRGVDEGREFGSYQIPTHIQVDDDGNEVVGAIARTQNDLTAHGYEASQLSSTNIHYTSSNYRGGNVNGDNFLRSVRSRNITYLFKTLV